MHAAPCDVYVWGANFSWIYTHTIYSILHPSWQSAGCHDQASTNVVAMRTLTVMYPNSVNVSCLSHILEKVSYTSCLNFQPGGLAFLAKVIKRAFFEGNKHKDWCHGFHLPDDGVDGS